MRSTPYWDAEQNVWVGGAGPESGAGGGGSMPSVNWVDLGVINAVDLVVAGAVTLYTPSAGELVSSVRFGDDLEETDVAALFVFTCGSYQGVPNGGGLWFAYADIPVLSALGVFDSAAKAIRDGVQNFNGGALQFINGRSVGILQSAPLVVSLSSDSADGATLDSPPGWRANHAYPGFGSTVIEAGHFWNTAPGGTSGNSKPNFAGNIGGSVTDNDITWTDAFAVPTQGHIHAYAEIVKPS